MGSELDEIVCTGTNSAGRVRPGVRGVGAVVLASLQKGAVRAGRDDRANITLGESGGRIGDAPRETKEEAECKVTRKLLGGRGKRGGGAEEGEGRAMDRSPDGGREGAVQQEMALSLGDPTRQETAAEEAVGVGGTAAETNMVSVVDDTEQRVSGRHGHEGTMKEGGKP